MQFLFSIFVMLLNIRLKPFTVKEYATFLSKPKTYIYLATIPSTISLRQTDTVWSCHPGRDHIYTQTSPQNNPTTKYTITNLLIVNI